MQAVAPGDSGEACVGRPCAMAVQFLVLVRATMSFAVPADSYDR
jgi:hypothetical protein